jgi:hypothetical protein
VRALNQFRLSDGRIGGSGPLAYREFQSGLFFANGSAKPSARTFANPVVARPRGVIWGQARRGGSHEVTIERRAPGSAAFRAVATARTNARGYFQRRLPRRSGVYRFRWADASGSGASEAIRLSR